MRNRPGWKESMMRRDSCPNFAGICPAARPTKPGTAEMVKNATSKKQQSNLPRLAAPAERALERAGVRTLEELSKFSESEVKQLHGIGPNALQQLHQALRANGLSFANEKIKKP
jgi:DNA-directed RNA polymerase alpha subunit